MFCRRGRPRIFFIAAATAMGFFAGFGGFFSIMVLFYGVIAALGT